MFLNLSQELNYKKYKRFRVMCASCVIQKQPRHEILYKKTTLIHFLGEKFEGWQLIWGHFLGFVASKTTVQSHFFFWSKLSKQFHNFSLKLF